MKKLTFLLAFLAILMVSCQKQTQSDLLPHQTVSFGVGSDFEIKMPGVLPGSLKLIALNGGIQPASNEDEVILLLQAKGSEQYDTIMVGPNIKIDNLNPDYFRYDSDKKENVLKGKILVNNMMLKNLLFDGNLSFIYNK
jgi:hypothetical protein